MAVDITSLVQSAFTTVNGSVAGAVKPATYMEFSAGTYDPATDTTTDTWTEYAINLIQSGKRDSEFEEGNTQTDAVTFLVPSNDLSGVEPSVEDELVVDNRTWRVMRIGSDPTGALYKLFCRAM